MPGLPIVICKYEQVALAQWLAPLRMVLAERVRQISAPRFVAPICLHILSGLSQGSH